jgi:hypothetical protein
MIGTTLYRRHDGPPSTEDRRGRSCFHLSLRRLDDLVSNILKSIKFSCCY